MRAKSEKLDENSDAMLCKSLWSDRRRHITKTFLTFFRLRCDWTMPLRQCSHIGRPRGIKKFAADKLRCATPVSLSLLSTVEAVATLVLKPDVARRTAIALMMSLDESSIFVNLF